MIAGRRAAVIYVLAMVAWAIALVLSLTYSSIVTQQHPAPLDPELVTIQERLKSKGSLSQADLDELGKIADRVEQRAKQQAKDESRLERIQRLQRHAVLIAWLPWAVVGWFALRTGTDLLPVIAAVASLIVLGAVPLLVAVVYVAVATLANLLRRITEGIGTAKKAEKEP
jgi:predicted PurR-regulated permease PerM